MRAKVVSVMIAALSIGSAQAALAADLAVKANPVAAAPASFSWTGFYAGVNAGGAWGSTKATDEESSGSCWLVCGRQWSSKPDGFTGGGQVGYNWQFGNFVFGLEGDVGYLGVKGSAVEPPSVDTFVNTRGGLAATARGRLGYAFNTVLVYGTGGWFGADLDSTVNDNVGIAVNTSSTGFRSGWTAGAGIEWAFASKWSVKAEWLHYDLGTEKVGGTFTGGSDEIQFFSIKNTGDIARVGLNYHF